MGNPPFLPMAADGRKVHLPETRQALYDAEDALCGHLQPVLEKFLDAGATTTKRTRDDKAGIYNRVAVFVDVPFYERDLTERFEYPDFVSYFRSDPHQGDYKAINCMLCHNSIESTRHDATEYID